ncbi:hypothetical protein D3C86_2166690 [compost metagenome]
MTYGATGSSKWFFRRPAEERGEVPDWKFLAKYYAGKGYTPADEAIDPAKASEKKQ